MRFHFLSEHFLKKWWSVLKNNILLSIWLECYLEDVIECKNYHRLYYNLKTDLIVLFVLFIQGRTEHTPFIVI